MNESLILSEFLRMVLYDKPGSVKAFRVKSKNHLLAYLARKSDLEKFDFIHIGCHGDSDLGILLPFGYIGPMEFEEGCFENKTVTLSACSLGKSKFARDFADHTMAKYVIGPTHDVHFADAALWFVTYYYLVLFHRRRPSNAVETTNTMLKGKVKGGFSLWY